MNTTFRPAPLLVAILLWVALPGEQSCGEQHAVALAQNAVLSWQSPRMQEIEKQFQQLWLDDSTRQRASPQDGKHIYSETMQACRRLFSKRLSYQDLRELVASSDTLPIRFQDRQYGFSQEVLEYMVLAFVELGDREALVEILSKRFVTNIGATLRVEYYLASRASLLQDFRGNRLKDPILVLGEAYFQSRTPEVRDRNRRRCSPKFLGIRNRW